MAQKGKPENLRSRAELALQKKISASQKTRSDKSAEHLIHELEVHQIELEMQNEELRASMVEVEISRTRYSDLYDFAPVGYFSLDKKGVIQELNLAGAQLLDAERQSLVHKPFSMFVHKQYVNRFFAHLKKVIEKQSRLKCIILLQLRPGSHKVIQRYVEMESIAVMDTTGNSMALRMSVSDITARKLQEEKLVRAGEEWERTFDIIPDIILIIDNQHRIKRANKALAKKLGVERDNLIGRTCYEVIHGSKEPPSYCPHIKLMSGGEEEFAEVYEEHLKDHFILSSTPVYDADGHQSGVVEVFREITARKEMEDQLKAAATTDSLTGLLNRRGFFTLAEQQCKLAIRSKKRMLLVYMDLDNMKEINDTLGHASGDRALLDTANIIKKTFRDSDIKGRIGGDEFVVLMTDPGPGTEQIVSKHFQKSLKTFNAQEDREYELAVSMGFSEYHPDHHCTIENLLNAADSNMYINKKKTAGKDLIGDPGKKVTERRLHKRYQTKDECWAEIGDSGRIRIRDISASGISLSDMPHLMTSIFQTMKIHFNSEISLVRAVMVWSQQKVPDNYEAGLKFVGLGERDRQSLEKKIVRLSS